MVSISPCNGHETAGICFKDNSDASNSGQSFNTVTMPERFSPRPHIGTAARWRCNGETDCFPDDCTDQLQLIPTKELSLKDAKEVSAMESSPKEAKEDICELLVKKRMVHNPTPRRTFTSMLEELEGEHNRVLAELQAAQVVNSMLKGQIIQASSQKVPTSTHGSSRSSLLRTIVESDHLDTVHPDKSPPKKFVEFDRQIETRIHASASSAPLCGPVPSDSAIPPSKKADASPNNNPSNNLANSTMVPQICEADCLDTLCVSSQEPSRKFSAGSIPSVPAVPSDAVEEFTVRITWEDNDCSRKKGITAANAGTKRKTLPLQDESDVSSLSRLQKMISYPSSPHMLFWDALGALLIMYDIAFLPLDAVFQVERHHTQPISPREIIPLTYWTLNMLVSPFVGFISKGAVVMDPRDIIVHYLRTWFLVDIMSVLPFWVGLFSGNQRGRHLRVITFLRLSRLIRLLKLKSITDGITDAINSEYTGIIMSISKMIVCMLFVNHYIACFWFWMSSRLADCCFGDETWVRTYQFDERSWDYQYFTSMHWSFTQFTPASMEVQPQNSLERAFALGIVLFGLIAFSYLLGSIAGSLGKIRAMQEETAKQFSMVRRFLRQTRVPVALSSRIQKYLQHAWHQETEQLTLSNVKVFKLLSEQLQSELQYCVFEPVLTIHPLMAHLGSISDVTMHRLSWCGLSTHCLARNDSLFFEGERACYMYFVLSGDLLYVKSDLHIAAKSVNKDLGWIAEPVLWASEWVHLGNLGAQSVSELLFVNVSSFENVITRSPKVKQSVQVYAQQYVKWLNQQDRSQLSDISVRRELEPQIHRFIHPSNSRVSGQRFSDAEMGGADLAQMGMNRLRRIGHLLSSKTARFG